MNNKFFDYIETTCKKKEILKYIHVLYELEIFKYLNVNGIDFNTAKHAAHSIYGLELSDDNGRRYLTEHHDIVVQYILCHYKKILHRICEYTCNNINNIVKTNRLQLDDILKKELISLLNDRTMLDFSSEFMNNRKQTMELSLEYVINTSKLNCIPQKNNWSPNEWDSLKLNSIMSICTDTILPATNSIITLQHVASIVRLIVKLFYPSHMELLDRDSLYKKYIMTDTEFEKIKRLVEYNSEIRNEISIFTEHKCADLVTKLNVTGTMLHDRSMELIERT